jgi:hypothetical protein
MYRLQAETAVLNRARHHRDTETGRCEGIEEHKKAMIREIKRLTQQRTELARSGGEQKWLERVIRQKESPERLTEQQRCQTTVVEAESEPRTAARDQWLDYKVSWICSTAFWPVWEASISAVPGNSK